MNKNCTILGSMNQYTELFSLIPDEDLISDVEKSEILADIDEEFLNNLDHSRNVKQLSAHSSGMLLPAFITILSIIITFIIILFSSRAFAQINESSLFTVSTNVSGSEWEILKFYMKESTRKLENKNTEINKYKGEIIDYDQKLTTLRELLNIKKETEIRLEEERDKLKLEGLTENDINSKISALEENLFSELAPGMDEFYSLGIDGLNKQIDQILDKKADSEEKLEFSLNEREILITEKKELEEDIKVKESEISQDPEVIKAMNNMSDIADQYNSDNLVGDRITVLYNEIFKSMDNNEYNKAQEKTDELQNLLSNNQLPTQIKIADTLKKYIDQVLVPVELSLPEKSENDLVIEEIAKITDKVTNGEKGDISIPDESELRSVISSIPAISKAFSLLTKTNEQESPELNDTNGQTVAGQEEEDPGELMLLGVISYIQFDHIVIESISGFSVIPGKEFYIFNRKDQAVKLGVGIITEVSEGNISGLLVSSSHPSELPEADDLVFINPDTINYN